jgi:hypothetical protein
MSEFGRIDDPVDASFEAWPDESGATGRSFGELALSFSGLVFPPAKILGILKDRFLPSSRFARIEYLLEGIRLKLASLESEIKSKSNTVETQTTRIREDLAALQSRIESVEFEGAVSVSCEEAVRAPDFLKIDQFVSILVGSLTANDWEQPDAEIRTMVRDVAQLGEQDIRVLDMLGAVFLRVMFGNYQLNDPNPFTEKMEAIRNAIVRTGLHRDDFYSTCSRLAGFGLAIEELRNTGRMNPTDRCFRPTRRGMALLTYLGTPETQERTRVG